MQFVIAQTDNLVPFHCVDVDMTRVVIVFRSKDQANELIPLFNSQVEIVSFESFSCFSDLRAKYPKSISAAALLVDF